MIKKKTLKTCLRRKPRVERLLVLVVCVDELFYADVEED